MKLRNNMKTSMGLYKDNVFARGLKPPECATILFNCLQNLETEIKNVDISCC